MDVIVDVHSHILPGLDDGSGNMGESMKMLQLAYRQGIRQIIATPHYSSRFTQATPERVRQLCRMVQKTARDRYGMDIRIRPGQEIMYTDEAAGLLGEGKILPMAGSRYVLVEFFPSVTYSFLRNAVRRISLGGHLPIIAHAERYACLRQSGKAADIKEQGCYIQLNYRSVGGSWHDSTTRWCRKIMKEQLVDFLGTDMHNAGNRSPSTEGAVRWMEGHLTRLYRRKLLYGNALKMMADEKI